MIHTGKRYLSFFLSVLLLHLQSLHAQEGYDLDSLHSLLNKSRSDSERISLMCYLSAEYSVVDDKKALDFANKAYEGSLVLLNKNLQVRSLLALGRVYLVTGNYPLTMRNVLLANRIAEEMNDVKLQALALHNIGTAYYGQTAIDSLKITQRNLKALEYYKKALDLWNRSNEIQGKANTLNNIGIIYNELGQYSLSLEYSLQANKLYEETMNKSGIASISNNIGLVYQRLKDFYKAAEYFQKTIDLAVALGDKQGLAIVLSNNGSVFFEQKKYIEAEELFIESFNTAKSINDKETMRESAMKLSKLYAQTGKYENAYAYHKIYSDVLDSLTNTNQASALAELQAGIDYQNTEKEIEILNKEKEISDLEFNKKQTELKQQTILSVSVVLGLILVLVIGFLIFRNNRQKQRDNQLLESAYEQLEKKNQLITDSIDSASAIQQAILPTDLKFHESFPNSFVLYMPKDVVSGDFYTVHRTSTRTLLAVVDCTGHGVSGAFMTFVANNILKSVFERSTFDPTDPAAVLHFLDEEIARIFSLQANTESLKSSMDIALFSFHNNQSDVIFAGAQSVFCILRNGEVNEYKGDRFHIGGVSKSKKYSNQTIQLQQLDKIYAFTDGYVDQLGGDKREKFFRQPLRDLFLKLNPVPIKDQRSAFFKVHESWKGALPQTDDILVIGIEV